MKHLSFCERILSPVNFLVKGGEQDESSFMGNENFKGVHIDEVGGKIRNRKKYAQQHRKR